MSNKKLTKSEIIMKTKMGRPKMPKAERRTAGIKLPLSAAEKAELEAAATASSVPLAGWIRMVALERARKERQENVHG